MPRSFSIAISFCATFSLSLPASAMLIDKIGGDFGSATVAKFMDEAQTDATPDDSTVGFTLQDNPLLRRWQLRAFNYLTKSPNLSTGLDVTLDTQLELDLYKFPKGHPQAVQWIVITGANCSEIVFDDVFDTIRIVFKPVKPAITPSLDTSDFTSMLAVDFYYSGKKTDPGAVTHGPSIVFTDAVSDDVGRPGHPSSDTLRGFAWQVNGIAGNPVSARYIFGDRFAAAQGFDPQEARGFLDGDPSNHGFTATLPAPVEFPIDLGSAAEEFLQVDLDNVKFSARDFQVGVFPPRLRIESIEVIPEGVRLTWNAEAGRSYAVESGPAPDQISHVEASGLSGPDFVDSGHPSDAAKFYRVLEE